MADAAGREQSSHWREAFYMLLTVYVAFLFAIGLLKAIAPDEPAELVLLWPDNNLTLHRVPPVESIYVFSVIVDPNNPSYLHNYGFHRQGIRVPGVLRLCLVEGFKVTSISSTSPGVAQKGECMYVNATDVPYTVFWNEHIVNVSAMKQLGPTAYIGIPPMPGAWSPNSRDTDSLCQDTEDANCVLSDDTIEQKFDYRTDGEEHVFYAMLANRKPQEIFFHNRNVWTLGPEDDWEETAEE